MNKQLLTRKQLGSIGEGFAFEYVQQLEYRIVERNWRCRTGEIDLIAQYDELLIFIEVRTRSGGYSFGTAEESVNTRKQHKIRETAKYYLLRYQMQNVQVRFDVISIQATKEGSLVSVNHLLNAF
jgi:putative endonuclease